jgi:hypothetical protein
MNTALAAVAALLIGVGSVVCAHAQSTSPAAGENRATGSPGSAGDKSDGSAVQHGAQPNPAEVRPGNRDGDAPSASVGTVVNDPVERRVLGLPITTAMVIGGVILAIVVLGGVAIPRARRGARGQGGGTYGRQGTMGDRPSPPR